MRNGALEGSQQEQGGTYSQVSRQGIQISRHDRQPELGAVGREHDAVLLAVAGGRAGAAPGARMGVAGGGTPGRAQRGAKPQRREPGHLGGLAAGAPGRRTDGRTGAVAALLASGSRGWSRGLSRRWGPPRGLGLASVAATGARDRAVREGQALLSDLRYSVSQAGLGKGGRHRRRRSQENFLRCCSLPFPPSFRAGRNFIQEKKKEESKETQSEESTACQRPALVWKRCPRA